MFDRLKQAANETKFKADQLLRVQRVQNEIAGVHQQLSAMRDRIGGRVLEMHQQGALGVPELEEMCAGADALVAQIAQKEAQIAAIKAEQPPMGAAPAPQPGYPQQGFSQQQQGFPPQQGFQQPGYPPQQPQQPQYAPPQPQVAMKTCPNCQAAVPAPVMFCTTCGFNFQQAPAAAAPQATKTCPNCQFEVPAHSAFCPNCGKPVA
jgi:hypothetical protein